MSPEETSLQERVKEFYKTKVRQPWKHGIDLALTAIVVTMAIVNLNLETGRYISAGTVGVIIVLCVFLRIKRGAYHDRRQKPKDRPIISPRVNKILEGLTKGEELVWESRQHPIAVIAWWIRATLLIIITIAAMLRFDPQLFLWIFEAAAVASLFMCGYEILSWHRFRFCITNRRVFILSGIIGHDLDTIQIDSITDKKTRETVPAKILAWFRVIEDEYGYGRLESAGQSQYVDFIGPLPFFGRISSLIDEYRSIKKVSETDALLERILETQEANNGLLTEMCNLLQQLTAPNGATVDQQTARALNASEEQIDFGNDQPSDEENDPR